MNGYSGYPLHQSLVAFMFYKLRLIAVAIIGSISYDQRLDTVTRSLVTSLTIIDLGGRKNEYKT